MRVCVVEEREEMQQQQQQQQQQRSVSISTHRPDVHADARPGSGAKTHRNTRTPR